MASSDTKKRLPRKDLPADAHIETLAVREGLPATQWNENSEALFLTSSFNHPDAATAAARFANEEEAFVYTRFTNPTTMMFERRLAALEGTEAAIATSSGMSAILLLIMGLLKSGDHVVCSRSVFGSTITLLQREFGKFGVESTFVSQTDLAEWRAAIKPNTKLFFAETPSNPLTEVCDVAALAEIAHTAGAHLAVDNCFCTPALQQPAKLGADFIVHSGTKYLDGQGRVMAGALCGPDAFINGPFMATMRGAGMCLSPFNAWVVLKGLETLSIRMAAQSANALKLAQWLEQQPQVDQVFYPGLPSHPQHALAAQQMHGFGGIVSVYVRGGLSKTSATLSSNGGGRYASRDFEGRGVDGGAGRWARDAEEPTDRQQHEAGGGPQPGPEAAEFLFEVLQLGHGLGVTAAGSCRGRAGDAAAPA